MIDDFAVFLVLQIFHAIGQVISHQLVDHRLEYVVVLARKQVFAAIIIRAEVSAPFEECLHDVIELQELVGKILMLYAAQFHETTVA